jgi:predicted nuclease with TOPRIM domain
VNDTVLIALISLLSAIVSVAIGTGVARRKSTAEIAKLYAERNGTQAGTMRTIVEAAEGLVEESRASGDRLGAELAQLEKLIGERQGEIERLNDRVNALESATWNSSRKSSDLGNGWTSWRARTPLSGGKIADYRGEK